MTHQPKSNKPTEQKKTVTQTTLNSGDNFFAFLRQPIQVRNMLLFGLLHLCTFLFIAYSYPMPYTNADTGGYLASFASGQINGYRPIGYSWVLEAFFVISDTSFFVFFAQFWLQAFANGFLLWTLQYFYRPIQQVWFWATALMLVLAPTILFLTNALLSDSIFNTLTLIWLTSGIWLFRRFSIPMLLLHLIAMYLAVNVRYTGLFYPVLSAILLFFQTDNKRYYLPILPILIMAYIYVSTKNQMDTYFGTPVFSAFSGWAQANNATAVIPYIDLKPEEIDNKASRKIHEFVIAEPLENYNTQNVMSTMFIWSNKYAGKKALFDYLDNNSEQLTYNDVWVRMGVLMGNYATLLQKRYPMQYLRHFILPNLSNVVMPKLDFIKYNNVEKTDRAIHFIYGHTSLLAYYDWIATYFSTICKPANMLLWLLTIVAIGIIIAKRKVWQQSRNDAGAIVWLLTFIVAYIGFSIIAHPFYLRYAIPLHAPQVALLLLAMISYQKSKQAIV